jgi:hypothetical protein
MGINARTAQRFNALTATALTGSAPQQASGNTVLMNDVEVGTLSAYTSCLVTVSSLTMTGKWQVSIDNSTWVDCATANNAANVAIATGTGSGVTTTRVIEAPRGVYGHLYARFVVVTGAQSALGAASEEVAISYNYRRPF